jgi:protein TonB
MAWRTKSSKSHSAIGLIAVIALHVVLVAALMTGLAIRSARKASEPILVVDVPDDQSQKTVDPDKPLVLKDRDLPRAVEPEDPGPITIQPDPSSGGAGGDITYPRPGFNSGEPEYPPTERRLGHAGQVVLTICIGADGQLTSATLKKSSGYALLDQSATNWARGIRWRAGTVGGRATSMCFDQPYRFVINDE